MSVYTLFYNLEHNIGDLQPTMSGIHNVIYHRKEVVELDTSDTRTITFPDYAVSQWVCILARVIGTAKLATVGVDADGSTAIEGVTGGYGTERHPGIIGITTKSVTSFTLTGLAADTTVEYIACILAEDDDTALTDNA